MEENGLICREISASDRRQSIISLTPQARALEKRYNQVSQQMNSLFFKDFEKAEIRELEQYLDRIVSNLERAEQALKKGKDVHDGKGKN